MDRVPALFPDSVYRELFVRSPDAIAIIDPESGKLVVTSPAMRSMLGYNADGLVSASAETICAMGPGETAAHVRAALEKGRHEFQSRWRRSDGGIVEVEVASGTIAVQGRTMVYAIAHDVTARKQAEAAQAREHRLFLRGPAVAFRWLAAPGWPVEYVSANVAQFGYDVLDFTSGRVPYASIIHPEDLARVGDEVERHSGAGATSFAQEYRIRRADGTWAHLLDQTVVVRGAGGSVTHFEGYVIDDTKRHDAEQALRESQRRLALLVKRSPIGIIVWNLDFTVREWNPEAAAIFGYKQADAVGMHAEVIVPEAIRPRIREIFDKLMRASGGERSLNENVTREGRTILCDWYNSPLVGDDGTVIGVASMVKNVTEEVAAQRALARSEEELRLITDALPALVGSVDAEGRYRFVNKTYAAWLGRPRDEIIGRSRVEFLGEEFEAALRSRIKQVMTGKEVHFENHLPPHLGGRTYDVTFVPHVVEERVAGYYVLALDITARRAVERELEQHRQHLESLVRQRTAELETQGERLRRAQHLASLGTLAAGVGHDVNNMLLPMRCAVDGLEAASSATGRAEHVAALRRSLEFMTQLASGLLQLASAPDDALRGSPRTRLAEWWARDGAMIAAASRGAVVKIDLPARLPDVAISHDHLTRAVLNLVVNAGEAAGTGGEARIWARVDGQRDGAVVLGVSDNGPGMTEEVRRRALEPFFTTKKRTLSTGLGLSLVHAAVQAVGGSVRVESSPGQGTTVQLTLPAASAKDGVGRASAGSSRRARVSVADDRMAGFILALLASREIPAERSDPNNGPGEASIWITDATTSTRQHLGVQTRKTIVVGDAPSEWASLGAILIGDATDVTAIAAALR